jgi:hypothetical protein
MNGIKLQRIFLGVAMSFIVITILCRSQQTNMVDTNFLKTVEHMSSKEAEKIMRDKAGVSEIIALEDKVRSLPDSNALTKLCEFVTKGDSTLGPNAASALGNISDVLSRYQINRLVMPSLIVGLECSNEAIRRESSITIAEHYSSFAEPAIPALSAIVNEPNEAANAAPFAVETLGKLGPAATGALPSLLQILNRREIEGVGGSLSLRAKVVDAIGKIGLKDPAVHSRIKAALIDPNPCVQAKSAQILLKNETDADRAIDTLNHLLQSDDTLAQDCAFDVVSELPSIPNAIIPTLQKLNDQKNLSGHDSAHRLLMRLQTQGN